MNLLRKLKNYTATAVVGYALTQPGAKHAYAQARPQQQQQQVKYAPKTANTAPAYEEETIKMERKMQDGTVVGFRSFKSGRSEKYILYRSQLIVEDKDGNISVPTREIYEFATSQPNFIFTKSNMRAPEPLADVEVKLVFPTLISRLEGDYPDAAKYMSIVQKYSAIYGIDPVVEMSILKVESSFGARIISPVTGAAGVNQLIPTTAEDLGILVFWPEGWSRERYIDATKNGNSDEIAEYATRLIQEHDIRKDGMGEIDGRFIDETCIREGMRYLKQISDKFYYPEPPPKFPSKGVAAYFGGPNMKAMTPRIEKYVQDVWDVYSFTEDIASVQKE